MGIIAYIYWDRYSNDANHVAIFNMEGELIADVQYSDAGYAGYGDTVVVDKNNNIFILGRWTNKILKLSSAGVQLVEVSANIPMCLALAPDGSIWNYEYYEGNGIFYKRNATTLEEEGWFSPPAGNYDYVGMAFDSDGYLYTVDYLNNIIEKWNVSTHTRVAYRALAGGAEDWSEYSSLTVMGSNIILVSWYSSHIGKDYFICPADLSSDFVAHTLTEFSGGNWAEVVSTYNENNYILCGDIDVNQPEIEKGQTIIRYDSSFNVVWQIYLDAVDGGMSVNAYPFPVAEVYDYPLYPVIFPLQT